MRRLKAGVTIGGVTIQAAAGLRELGLAVFLLAILILRPKGIAGGREVPVPRFLRR